MSKTIYYDLVEYDAWSFYLCASSTGLCFVGSSPANKKEMEQWVVLNKEGDVLIQDAKQLSSYKTQFIEYLAGERQWFTLPLDTEGTDFQKQVWHTLQKIPYGQTKTYGEIAELLGKSVRSARAVGTAVGQNPVLMIYPCHRVVPKDGIPKNFRGGLEMKKTLLELEKEVLMSQT